MTDDDRWITIDPGETTGYAIWSGTEMVRAGQTPMWEFIDDLWDEQMDLAGPTFNRIVCEDWALYPSSMHELAWDKCRTARAIGAISLIARRSGTEMVLQPALIKDAAIKAGAEALYVKPNHPNRHANDAIQHGVYFMAMTWSHRVV